MERGEDHGDVALFIRLDRLGVLLGMAFVAFVNGVFVRNGQVWLIMPVFAVLLVALVLAGTALTRGQLLRALILTMVGNWIVAIGVAVLFPFLWPVMTLTVLMPMVLASPHVSGRQMTPAIVLTSLIAAVVGTIGLSNDDGGAIADIADEIELAIVLAALVVQIIPIGLITWQYNARQRQNLNRVSLLNDDLRASQTELAASRNRVVEAADFERRRIERDLHDGAQQNLVALGMRLRLLESQGHQDPLVRDGITSLISGLDEALREVRELAHGIYPPLLQTRGLPDALAAVGRRSPLEVQVDLAEIGRLEERCETALYFVALEALTNAAKHAGGAAVELRLWQDGDEIGLSVTDDGPGYDTSEPTKSHGLLNMRDRLAAVGGRLEIDSHPGDGTTVSAFAPRPG